MSLTCYRAALPRINERYIILIVEIDATKYRSYFLNHRLFYEFVGTGIGIIVGFYIHVYLFDAIFSIADVLSGIESGRKHRAIFFIASIIYLIKIIRIA